MWHAEAKGTPDNPDRSQTQAPATVGWNKGSLSTP